MLNNWDNIYFVWTGFIQFHFQDEKNRPHKLKKLFQKWKIVEKGAKNSIKITDTSRRSKFLYKPNLPKKKKPFVCGTHLIYLYAVTECFLFAFFLCSLVNDKICLTLPFPKKKNCHQMCGLIKSSNWKQVWTFWWNKSIQHRSYAPHICTNAIQVKCLISYHIIEWA